MELAPIALFVYKRLWHTQQTVAALLKNVPSAESKLYVFADAAKNTDSVEEVRAVRDYLRTIQGFKEIHIIERPTNLGLAQSIIQGVGELTARYDRVIVVEDDLVVSSEFLSYMNRGLEIYANVPNVASICGFTPAIKTPMPDTYFLKGTDCWGWATWQRAWQYFEPNGTVLLQALKSRHLLREFDLQGAQGFTQMLQDQIAGRNNSWAIRWHASAFLRNMISLYPGKSLVQNIGMDNSGEHCVRTDIMDVQVSNKEVAINDIPLQQEPAVLQAIIDFYQPKPEKFLAKCKRKTKQLMRRLYVH